MGVQGECYKADTMPLMLELKYEYFPATWPGRINLLELIFAFFCMVCSAAAYEGSQHWFLFVVVVAFIGSIFFSLYYLCLAEPLNKLQVHWLMVEFWFTAIAAFGYFTAFIAMLAEFAGVENDLYQYWIDANVAAGVVCLTLWCMVLELTSSTLTGRLTPPELLPPLHKPKQSLATVIPKTTASHC